MMITVFTPTYNRAYRLSALYESLCKQTCKDFEWLIVDDGSTDNTEELVRPWLQETSFSIRYIKQVNGGKHTAINRGVKEAKGELFFIVDSDDVVIEEAVYYIVQKYNIIKNRKNTNIGGLCFRRYDVVSHCMLGNPFPIEDMIASSWELTYKYRVLGDKAEIFKTSILAEFPFPEIKGEKFVPESLVWNRIANKYKLCCNNIPIYKCEYLIDGLSSQFNRLRKNNPKAYLMYYKEVCLGKYTTLFDRLKCLVRYIQCIYYRSLKK